MQPGIIYSQRKWSFISMIALSIGVFVSNIPVHSPLSPPTFFSWLTHATIMVAYRTPVIQLDYHSYKDTEAAPSSTVTSVERTKYMHILKSSNVEPLVTFLSSKYELSKEEAEHILGSVIEYSKTYKVEPDLILAIIRVESSFLQDAESRVGARGLMQVMPNIHKTLVSQEGGRLDDLWEPSFNIKIGTMILKQMLRASSGNLENGLARYNGSYSQGTINAYATKVLSARTYFRQYNKFLTSAL